jgi:hypothetical protein
MHRETKLAVKRHAANGFEVRCHHSDHTHTHVVVMGYVFRKRIGLEDFVKMS